ncbi:hypothetical protein [Mesorhizobium sp. B4-1-4]|uniref:hypothetical protein n=1 Tax=Mesorhizobium sp. B4-1-4 TaxID=2589888 RepID=UPI001D00DDCE|nr:hypothetical protein [Mesorhizobium sp. B4-1-4]UCI31925.1 hypothetical protein FJW03_00065 [Mesorhizobium sp. B4-1-4]
MSAFPTARTAIVGAATFGEGHCPGYTPYDMAAIAARDALAEAGLSFADVDGVFVTTSTDTFFAAARPSLNTAAFSLKSPTTAALEEMSLRATSNVRLGCLMLG